MRSQVTLRAPDFRTPPAPQREIVKQQILALPDYPGAHTPTSATLLGLPYLVRLAILELVLVAKDSIKPCPYPRCKHHDGNYDTAVLRVNKQLCQEASHILYMGNTFVFTKPYGALDWMYQIGGNQQLLYSVTIFLTTGITPDAVTYEQYWAQFFAWLGLCHPPKLFSVNFEDWVELKLNSTSNSSGRRRKHSEVTLISAARNRVYIVYLLSKMRGFKEVNTYLGDFMSRNAGKDLLIAMMAPSG